MACLVASLRARPSLQAQDRPQHGQFPAGQETSSFPSVVSAQCHLPARSLIPSDLDASCSYSLPAFPYPPTPTPTPAS